MRHASRKHDPSNPFCSEAALRHSNYSALIGGKLVRLLDFKRPSPDARVAHEALRKFLRSDGYPCVAARSVFNRANYRFGYYENLTSPDSVSGLARDLCAFVAERSDFDGAFCSFLAAFAHAPRDENEFESALWTTLTLLRRLDAALYAYCSEVSSDPTDRRYAFSFAQTAFFVVGMHPQASRLSRRFAYPLLVFNPHDQFEALRREGRFERFQQVVRASDLALQGSLNPNLSDFGVESEARQYSGKAAPSEWTCPLHP